MSFNPPARVYAGAASAATLKAAISSTSTTFQPNSISGWVDVTGGNGFGAGSTEYCVVAFGYGTSSEEKMLCQYNSSDTTFTITQRGYDGTPQAATWPVNTTFNLVWSATEASEANAAALAVAATVNAGATLLNSATTALPNVTSVNGTSIPASGTLVTSASTTLPTGITSAPDLTTVNGTAIPASATLVTTTSTTALPLGAVANATTSWYPTPVTSGSVASTATSVISQAIPTSPAYSSYLITFDVTVLMGSTAHNINASVGINGSSASGNMTQYLVASQSGSTSISYIYTPGTPGTAFTVNGMLFTASGAGATISFASLSIVGLA
jgi:hypothetical protein